MFVCSYLLSLLNHSPAWPLCPSQLCNGCVSLHEVLPAICKENISDGTTSSTSNTSISKAWGLPHLRNGIFVRFLNTQPSQFVNVCVCETLTTTKIGKNLSSLPSKSVTTWQSLKKKELHLQIQAKKQVIKTIKTFMSKSQTRVSWAHLLDTGAEWCITSHLPGLAFVVVSQTCRVQENRRHPKQPDIRFRPSSKAVPHAAAKMMDAGYRSTALLEMHKS